MCFDYDGACDVYEDTSPRARKEYRCCDCGGVIAKGETYHKNTQLFDGNWSTFRECVRCQGVRAAIAQIEREHGCRGDEAICPFGKLREAIEENSDHYGMLLDDPDDPGRYGWRKPIAVMALAAHLFPELPQASPLPATQPPRRTIPHARPEPFRG